MLNPNVQCNLSVRTVSHVVADFMVNGNPSGQISLRFHVVWQVFKSGQIFDSQTSHMSQCSTGVRPMCLGDLQLTTFKLVSLSLNG